MPRGPGMTELWYVLLPSPFGPFAILWRETERQPYVLRVFLSTGSQSSEQRLRAAIPDAQPHTDSAITELGHQMQAFLEGQPIQFALHAVALENCSEFQQRVLVAEHGIPRGRVSTYGLIAAHLGVEKGARAVGTALARNPFPLIIPCHRAIRSNGELGGYQGGLDMKRRLLQLEGVEVSEAGLVVRPRLHYAT